MFLVTKTIAYNGKSIIEATCLSSDEKPTNYGNNSLCVELDTGDIYYMTNGSWSKFGGE